MDPVQCTADGALKLRRGVPHVRAGEFKTALQLQEGKWIWVGCMNGWGSLTDMQLLMIKCKASKPLFHTGQAHANVDSIETPRLSRSGTNTDWEASSQQAPSLSDPLPGMVRLTLKLPEWSMRGWSADSPGFAFHYRAHQEPPRMLHGERMIAVLRKESVAGGLPVATRAHHFAHRYPVGGTEGVKDRFSYHAGVMVEWDHGEFVSVMELAFWNGVP